jgi:hypothetical protein
VNTSLVPAPLARDLRHWSSCARMWRLETTARGMSRQAVAFGARLEDLEAVAARSPRASMDEPGPTFFRLPDGLRDEAVALDPGLLLRAGEDPETHRFVQRFAGYLEFLGLALDARAIRARACITAPSAVSSEIVRPFGEPGAEDAARDDDTIVCCNLSESPARIALRQERQQRQEPLPPTRAETPGSVADSMSDSIALALEMGECLVGLRRSILGYIPDEQGEPTLWFECLLRIKSSGALP